MDQDTFSMILKEELCHKTIKGRKKTFWELFALLKFLNPKGKNPKRNPRDKSSAFAQGTIKPFLMRRIFKLMKHSFGDSPSLGSTGTSVKNRRHLQIDLTPRMKANIFRLPSKDAETLKRQEEPRRGFLLGVFLARGYVSSPAKNHHLEISLPVKKDALLVKTLMEMENLQPGLVQRRAAWVVYLKDSDDISEFMKILGASQAVLEYENMRVQKEVKSRVQRLVNMDGANVGRAVEAAMRQSSDIDLIDQHMGLHNLPQALKEIALLRKENPDLSMEELGQILDPPLSKSAVNHRLRRIAKIAQSLKDPGQG